MFNSHWRSMWGYYMILFVVLEIPLTDRPFIPHPHVTTEKIQSISACLLPSSILTKKPGIY